MCEAPGVKGRTSKKCNHFSPNGFWLGSLLVFLPQVSVRDLLASNMAHALHALGRIDAASEDIDTVLDNGSIDRVMRNELNKLKQDLEMASKQPFAR